VQRRTESKSSTAAMGHIVLLLLCLCCGTSRSFSNDAAARHRAQTCGAFTLGTGALREGMRSCHGQEIGWVTSLAGDDTELLQRLLRLRGGARKNDKKLWKKKHKFKCQVLLLFSVPAPFSPRAPPSRSTMQLCCFASMVAS